MRPHRLVAIHTQNMHRFGGSHAIAAAGADILDTVAVRVAACWLAGCVARAFAARCVIALYAVHMNIVPALFQNEITEGFCRFGDAPADARVVTDFQVAGFGSFSEFLVVIGATPAAILYAALHIVDVYALVEFRCNNFENASVKSSCPDI